MTVTALLMITTAVARLSTLAHWVPSEPRTAVQAVQAAPTEKTLSAANFRCPSKFYNADEIIGKTNEKDGVFDSFVDDFWSNLAWFVIETIVTVAIIDRLIKYGEERRWRPARGLLLSQLLKVADTLLFWTLPTDFRALAPAKFSFSGTVGRTNLKVLSVEDNVLKRKLADEALARSEVSVGPLAEAAGQLEYIKQYAGLLIDAPVLNLVLQLGSTIDMLTAWQTEQKNDDEWKNDYAKLAKDVIDMAMKLRELVVKQADST